jgi:hypothetical protein
MIYEMFVPALSLIFTTPAVANTVLIERVSHSCEVLGLTVGTAGN